MHNFLGACAFMLVGLLLGAAFSDTIYMDMSLTDWSSLWTWGWIFMWPLFLAVQFFVVFIVFVCVAGLCMLVYTGGQQRGWWP